MSLPKFILGKKLQKGDRVYLLKAETFRGTVRNVMLWGNARSPDFAMVHVEVELDVDTGGRTCVFDSHEVEFLALEQLAVEGKRLDEAPGENPELRFALPGGTTWLDL